jgi:hypothetical protein
MGTVTLTEASFVFLGGHEIDLVEIHNVVKFLANGLYKSDIYESVETPLLYNFPYPNCSVLLTVSMHVAT